MYFVITILCVRIFSKKACEAVIHIIVVQIVCLFAINLHTLWKINNIFPCLWLQMLIGRGWVAVIEPIQRLARRLAIKWDSLYRSLPYHYCWLIFDRNIVEIVSKVVGKSWTQTVFFNLMRYILVIIISHRSHVLHARVL